MAHGDTQLSYAGRNFAPVKPLQDAKATATNTAKNGSSVNAFFREIWQEHSDEYEAGWRELIDQAKVVSLLASGKYAIKHDIIAGGWAYFKRTPSTNRTNYPLFPQNYEQIVAKWSKVKPLAAARNFGDGYKAELQLAEINTIAKAYFRDIFTSDYETREAHSALNYGGFITQFEYDDELNQMIQVAPIIQNESQVTVPGYGACYDCGFEGHPDDFAKTGAAMPQCPECESYRTTRMVPDAMSDAAVIVGADTITQGDICGHLRDFAACRYDPRVFAHESSWFIYSERLPLRMIRKMFGADVQIDDATSDEIEFQITDALSMRGGTTEGNNVTELTGHGRIQRFTEEGTLRSMWLKPEEYAGFKLDKPEKTLAGTIPADVDFAEIFPEGVCVRGYNEMNLQTGIWATKANLASNVYIYQSHSGIGKGADSAVDVALDLNEVMSMAMAGIKRHGAAGLVIDKDAGLTQADVRKMFQPDKAVFADLTHSGGDVNKAVMKVRTDPVNPALPQMIVQLANLLNLAFMTGDFSQGQLQQVDINTLGGQQLATAKAEEQKAGIWGRKTSHRMMSAEIIVDLHRKHIKIPRWYAHEGDNHGTIKGKWISGENLPARIKFDAIPDSEMPQNKFEKNIAKDEMIDKAGGIVQFTQAMMADPKIVAWYAQGRGLELPGTNEDEIRLVTIARLDEVKQLSELYPDPEMVLQSLTCKLRVREDAHVMKAEFLQKILDDDEIQTWNPVALAAIELWIERHYQLEAEAQVRNETIRQMAMNQLAMQQGAANAQMMQPEMAAQQQAADSQMQNEALAAAAAEVGSRVLDDEQKQVDADREEDAKEADFARSERAADAQNKRQIELEQAKAKARPAPAKAKAQGSGGQRK